MKELKLDDKDFKKIFLSDTAPARFWRATKKFSKQLLVFGLVYIAFFILLNYSAYWNRLQYTVSAKPVEKVEPRLEPIITEPIIQYSPEIQIPKLGIIAPLNIEVNPLAIIESLKTGVSQYQDTAKPGQIGNSVIVGHSSDFPWSDGQYKNIFSLLDKLVPGDQIIIPFGHDKFIYEVYSSKVVKPTDLSVLRRTDGATLTLLTCYPIGTTRSRLIITARLISNNATTQQVNVPFTGLSLPKPR